VLNAIANAANILIGDAGIPLPKID